MKISVHSPDDLVAVLPHLLGFKPEESMVFVPLFDGLPVVRVDLPRSPVDREQAWESLAPTFVRHAGPGAAVGIICVTTDRAYADQVSQEFAARCSKIGIATWPRVWADDTQWCDFGSGDTGLLTKEAAERIAALAVLEGRAQPLASREAMASSLVGDREPIAELLPTIRQPINRSTAREDASWASTRLARFHTNGRRLSDRDAGRLLVAIEQHPIRDLLWSDMNPDNVASHVALWTDLTQRAPDEVRAAPAALLGFAAWLGGDGAKAQCAIDQVPQSESYPLAGLVASAVQTGMHPREWESVRHTGHDPDFTAPHPSGSERSLRRDLGI